MIQIICFLNAVGSYDADDCAENVKHKFSEVEILNPYDVNEPFTSEKQGIPDIHEEFVRVQRGKKPAKKI
ncbi:hypothetical protein MCHI_003736 [Candidatus Magnetoovum chiemensis]|nr:hypothetical protein MCHI_003736 [Candidatus Magnetoovum chiemensis]